MPDAGPASAPALNVSGIDFGSLSIGDLTGGGGALLLFVNEECPTSAMTMRNLGPLCADWQRAGLSCTAIFEDPLEVAIRTARRCGWTGRVAAQAAPYDTSRDYGLVSVPTAFLVDGAGSIRARVTGWDHAALTDLIAAAGALTNTTLTAPAPTRAADQARLLVQGGARPRDRRRDRRGDRQRRTGGDVRARLDRRAAGDPADRRAGREDAGRPRRGRLARPRAAGDG